MTESGWGPASPDTVKRWGMKFRERGTPVKKKAVVVVKKKGQAPIKKSSAYQSPR